MAQVRHMTDSCILLGFNPLRHARPTFTFKYIISNHIHEESLGDSHVKISSHEYGKQQKINIKIILILKHILI